MPERIIIGVSPGLASVSASGCGHSGSVVTILPLPHRPGADVIAPAGRVLNKAMARAAEADFAVKLRTYRQDLQDEIEVRVGTAPAVEVVIARR
jgi:predicted urease superfamily metal-dependent hydrolase